jgi:uracil-DNA glycosylase
LDVIIEASWKQALKHQFELPYYKKIKASIKEEKDQGKTIFPPESLIFRALELCPLNKVKVVIVGQDPYHGFGQAHGLCFSVPHGIAPPPSLVNIFKELHGDLGVLRPNSGSLEGWARQGVLLLNTSLTVRAHEAGSHFYMGWGQFTDEVIRQTAAKQTPVVYLLWGKPAQSKKALIPQNVPSHLILEAPHPSPLSAHRGFLGCKHFSKTNEWLRQKGVDPIRWDHFS